MTPTNKPGLGGHTLSEVLRAMYASEIGCGLESFWDEGWTVWIGDRMNGRYREALFENADFDKIPEWIVKNTDDLIGEWKRGRAAIEARSAFHLCLTTPTTDGEGT